MPPKKFLDTFLPVPQHTQQYPESIGDFENVLEASKEVNMYTPFVSMVLVYFLACSMNIRQITAAAGFAPSLKFVDTHANPDTQRDTLAPDIAVYPIADQSQGDAKTEWTFLLNSNSRTHLTRSATQRILCNRKRATFASRVIRTMLGLFVANWPPTLLLTWGVSFAFTFSVYSYAENT
jgi:hypothetical protein